MAERIGISDRYKSVFILLYAVVIITVFIYYGSAEFYLKNISSGNGFQAQYYYFLSSFVLMGFIPVLIWLLGFKNNLPQMGLSFGKFKTCILFTVIGLPVVILIAFLTAKNPSFRAEYPLYQGLLSDRSEALPYWLMYALYYIGWEVFFRGFVLFGLKDQFGEWNSILIQTIPSCLAHIGKPDAEIFGSIIAGILFGWVALRCRSLWPVFIWHWALGVFLDIFIIYG